jgi:surfactin synthase thioesterase subunit
MPEHPRTTPSLRLFCFPYAGGGAAIYRSWADLLPPEVDLCIVQLPGRENRLAEQPIADLPTLVDEVVPAMTPLLDLPFAFFGHSMGALLSFEVARALRDRRGMEPAQLFLSAFRAPHVQGRRRSLHHLPHDALVSELQRLNGTPPEILQDGELLRLVLPAVRADMQACETYQYTPAQPFGCPITVFGGVQDHDVSRADLEAWRDQTTGAFMARMLPGDHFFINTARPILVHALALDLTRLYQSLLTGTR